MIIVNQGPTYLFAGSIVFLVTDPDVWNSSKPLSIPRDIFNGKSFNHIVVHMKVADVDPDAFLSSHSRVETLSINSGAGNVLDAIDAINPIER